MACLSIGNFLFLLVLELGFGLGPWDLSVKLAAKQVAARIIEIVGLFILKNAVARHLSSIRLGCYASNLVS